MSVSDRTPTSLPSATTGTPEIRCASISAAARFNGVSGETVITGAVMTSSTFIASSFLSAAAPGVREWRYVMRLIALHAKLELDRNLQGMSDQTRLLRRVGRAFRSLFEAR